MDSLEVVIVSVGFGDYLAHTLPLTAAGLDDLVVVTSETDYVTQAVALAHRARVVTTAVEDLGVLAFDRARLLNLGIQHCRRDGWLLVLDADIALPPRLRQTLASLPLDRSCIYGVDRVLCPSYAEWSRHQQELQADVLDAVRVPVPGRWPLGLRLSDPNFEGWLPLGYFQLWHSSVRELYPVMPGAGAEYTDLLHAACWPRCRRVLLPDLVVVHLAAAAVPLGYDWHGRRSPAFGPELPAWPPATVRNGHRPPPATAPVSQTPATGGGG